MNVFEEKLTDWSQQQFNIKVQNKDSLKNGEQIKRFCDSIECQKQIKATEKEIEDIRSHITDITTKLLTEELNKKSFETKEELNQNKEFLSNLILNTIEKISAKNKLCTQLKPNLKAINETTASYENFFINDDLGSKTDQTISEVSIGTNNFVLSQLLEQINQLISKIDEILYDLSNLEVKKPIKISIDSELVFKCLVESRPQLDIKITGEENESKSSAITSKLVSVTNLMNKYQTIRSEKLTKNKEKLEKVINSCDEFIQQSV